MIADTNFLIDLFAETQARQSGAATRFRNAHRNQQIRITAISIAEFSAGFQNREDARPFLDLFRVYRLFPEAAYSAGDVDRELIAIGARLGEADTLIAGIALYYGEPLISNDAAFQRVRRLRVHPY
jgi:predicted nucleic acid-binding protein